MAKNSKWIFGSLGWLVFGPLGGILGFLVGQFVDSDLIKEVLGERSKENDFALSLLVLSSAVIKADGKVDEREIQYVKTFFAHNFGAEKAAGFMRILDQVLRQDIPLRDMCQQIRMYMDFPGRRQLLHYLFGLAKADGKISKSELYLIADIAGYLGLKQADFNTIKAMFITRTNNSHVILGVSEKATKEEIRSAYRSLVRKHHPDKVAHLGEDVQNAAKEKFQKIQEAYEELMNGD